MEARNVGLQWGIVFRTSPAALLQECTLRVAGL
jgi:hypothetical protein